MENKKLIEKLQNITQKAKENEVKKIKDLEKREQEKQLNEIKKSMKILFDTHASHGELIKIAEKGCAVCPLLFVGEDRIVKNKKEGYRPNLSTEGKILFDILVENNFEPAIIDVPQWEFEPKPHNPHYVFPYNEKIVSRKGKYLGISWRK